MAQQSTRDAPVLSSQQFDHAELPRFKKRQELSPEELPGRELLTDFCLKLSRAVLQSSYYSPDHPQARKVADEPYQVLKELGPLHEEFNFVVASWLDGDAMALEGIFNEAISLEQILGGSAGEHFSKKLCDFSKRNRLVSFSIKNVIAQDEFHRFITVFVERHVDMEAQRLLDQADERRGAKFTEQLLDKNVVNVSVVLEDDLIEEKRRLPWRVKIALARLTKDLKLIPIYSKATSTQLRDAKMRLLRDILRPLQKGQYLKQLFLNLDLIADQVVELRGVDMENDLIAALSLPRLLSLAESLLAEHVRITRKTLTDVGEIRADLAEAVVQLMGRVGTALAPESQDAAVSKVLRDLFDEKAVPLTLLPKAMQDQVRMDRWTANYLASPDSFIQEMELIDRADIYVTQIPYLVGIIPNLIRVRKYGDAERLMRLLEQHQAGDGRFAGRPDLVRRALGRLDDRAVFALLAEAMLTEPQDVREVVRKVFVGLGVRTAPTLIEVIGKASASAVRNEAGATLIALGAAVVPQLELAVARRGTPAHALPVLLRVLAQLEATSATDLIVDALRHARPDVREAAVVALAKIHGRESRGLLVRVLRDGDNRVAVTAMRLLERLGARPPGFIMRLLEFAGVAPRDTADTAADRPEMQVAAVQSLAELGNVRLGEFGTLEERLIDRLTLGGGTVMAILERGKKTEDDAVRLAVVDALVKIGGEPSITRFKQHSVEPNPIVRERMKDAAGLIERRLTPA